MFKPTEIGKLLKYIIFSRKWEKYNLDTLTCLKNM